MPAAINPALFPYAFPAAAAVLGLFLGSFYSVCVSRGIEETSIVSPPSHCPACGHRLRPWELIPLVSWLALGGRCSSCRQRISMLYPLIELTSALVAALLAARFGPTWWFVGHLALGGLFIVASGIDFQVYLLPNYLTYPAAVLGIALGALDPAIGPVLAGVGAVVGCGVFWLLAAAYRTAKGVDGLGGGDVKLMLAIGGAVGGLGLPYAVLLGSLAALLASPFYIFGRGRGRQMPIPFGPFLCFGGMVQILYGHAIFALLAGR
ncbi:prepilin peptidase [Desulfovibrio sp. TomC]|uniref:prepilin peptidase n=1 Tax=Desulfovibrio sp. TomC TaxID=1562888 RepID=UPI000573FA42|nr:A24 family peptidase [Desulfovibrio sp. TomC]KHK03470.1 Leader peptidase (Prepilin peptidase) [Desulfovibrio sp. TomC]